MDMPNIAFLGDVSKFIVAKDDEYETISYNKDLEFFGDSMNTSKFIKDVERQVRTSKEYAAFISWIKDVVGINFCQISSKIYDRGKDDRDAEIELHHGPLFTLYDVCDVILTWFIKNGYKITTFRVADKVIDEHFARRVQCVMLAKTNHEAVHNRDIFLHVKQGIGNLDAFIKKYTDCLGEEQKYKIWNYMTLCETEGFGESFDTGILDMDYIKKYIQL